MMSQDFFLSQYLFLGRARDTILKDVNLDYEKDPALLADIISALPKKMESTLNLHKSRILGSLPKSRDEFDPLSLLTKLDGGDKVMVCDSNRDLPKNWKEMDIKEAFGNVEDEAADNINPDLASSDDCASTDEGMSSDDGPAVINEDDGVIDNDDYQDVLMNTISVEATNSPKRVLVFTTMVLLGLLGVCKYGSMTDKDFRDFVRSVTAMPFLPSNQIEAAIDDLRSMALSKESESFDKICKFQEEYLDYIESTWIHGNFPPKLWNLWKKASNLTNNNN